MIKIDLENHLVTHESGGQTVSHALGSPAAFALISQAWLRCGWDTKHVYTFTWLGRPIIQLPEDMLRLQEVIFSVQPDVIIETGVAHGGGLVFYASLCKMLGKGRVLGVDIEIRPANRRAIEEHFLAPYITLIQGSSIATEVLAQIHSLLKPGESVLVILDSNHSKAHVRAELEAYGPLVTPNSYLIATDGIMKDLVGAPRSMQDWATNNPFAAAREFLSSHPEFREEQPAWLFNESNGLTENITYWPGAYLKRV